MVGHNPRTSPENYPSHKRADNRITYSDPCGGKSVFPSKLSGITYEHNGRKIGCTVCKRSKPRANVTASKNKTVNIFCTLLRCKSDKDHNGKKQDQQCDFDKHDIFLPYLIL